MAIYEGSGGANNKKTSTMKDMVSQLKASGTIVDSKGNTQGANTNVGNTNTSNASRAYLANYLGEAEKAEAKRQEQSQNKVYTQAELNNIAGKGAGRIPSSGGDDETATDTELGNAIASWYASMQAKNDEYYDKAQKASDLNYNKIRRAYLAQNARSKRQLKGEYAKIGQNPSHSTGWDMDYATSKNLADLDISRAQDDASIAKGRYDANNTLVSNVLGSGLSNSALLKALKGII